MKHVDIVINSDDEVYMDGKPVEKIKPSVSDYLTNEEKQSIIDNLLLARNNTKFTPSPKTNNYFYGKREALTLTKKQPNIET